MSIQDWGAIGEIVSGIAVVISLVYLALQMRMNTKTLKANAAWDSEITFGNSNADMARDPLYALLISRASRADSKPEDFTEAETAQLYFGVRAALQIAQAQWWLWRSGNLPDELWEYRRRWARLFVEAPVISPIWQAELEQHVFSQQFVQDILTTERHGELSLSPHQS
jgi:hypothetical protein